MQNDVVELIATVSGFETDEISYNDYLEEDLGFDSIMMIDLYQTILNSKLDLNVQNITKEKLRNDVTVDDFLKLLGAKTNNEPQNKTVVGQLEEIQAFKEYFQTKASQIPYFKKNQGVARNKMLIDGNSYINFSTYNYLGLNGNQEVSDYAIDAIKKYGTSVSGSRLLSGEIEIHQKLEREISSFLGTEDSLVQVGGHSTSVITSLVNSQDLIIHDSLSHNSIIQGAIYSGAQRKAFKHNDMNSLDKLLSRLHSKFRRILIIVEGVYSMDGDICDLPNLLKIKEKYGAMLMIDEAHSFGTIGKHGRGVTSYFDVDPTNIDILMGTLSKSASSCGGYIAGSKDLINYLRYNMGGFVFSCGITPSNAAAALKSIEIMKRDDISSTLMDNSKYFLSQLKELSIDTGLSSDTPIVPWIIGDSDKTLMISNKLFELGVNAMPIIYPAVNEEESRIRFFISSLHTKEDLDRTIEVIKNIKKYNEGK